MADIEPIAKRLTDLQAKLTERAGAISDPKNADRALMLSSLALLAEGLAKVQRDVRALKGPEKKGSGAPKAAGPKAPGAGGPKAGKGPKKGAGKPKPMSAPAA